MTKPLDAYYRDATQNIIVRKSGTEDEQVFIAPEPIYDWSVTIGSHTFQTRKGREPNAFHRWMQEKLLGFKWKRNNRAGARL